MDRRTNSVVVYAFHSKKMVDVSAYAELNVTVPEELTEFFRKQDFCSAVFSKNSEDAPTDVTITFNSGTKKVMRYQWSLEETEALAIAAARLID